MDAETTFARLLESPADRALQSAPEWAEHRNRVRVRVFRRKRAFRAWVEAGRPDIRVPASSPPPYPPASPSGPDAGEGESSRAMTHRNTGGRARAESDSAERPNQAPKGPPVPAEGRGRAVPAEEDSLVLIPPY